MDNDTTLCPIIETRFLMGKRFKTYTILYCALVVAYWRIAGGNKSHEALQGFTQAARGFYKFTHEGF